jgi:DNA-binding response OmpR family regulator
VYVVARGRDLVRQHGGTFAEERTTILVIDDSTTFREKLREALEQTGYTAIVAPDGEEGLRLAATRRPNGIIVDCVMPGIDGSTVIRRIRLDAALRRIPCLLLTGSDDLGAEVRALDSGADGFVRKEADMQVILARLAAALRSAPTQRDETAGIAGPTRVLAVDDSVTYLNEIANVLREDGYDVVLSCSGEEAIEMLAAQAIDCILLDLLMPGLGGKETCRRIKALHTTRDIPLIMLTALEDQAAMIEGLGTGADDYISKSSEFDVLRARVRAQIRRKHFEDENRRIREQLLRRELEAAEARAARELAETRAALVEELESKNRELEAFSYSVSHDLRAPLRSIDGFSQALLEDYTERLDAKGQNYLRRVVAAAQKMGELIDDLLQLSRAGRAELRRERVDVSAIALAIATDLRSSAPTRVATFEIAERLYADADPRLLRIVLENLFGNAWKFASTTAKAVIEFGATHVDGTPAYFVRDNGVGFSMAYAAKLFTPFQRLHSEAEFPGTGIGLATVRRIVERHGGRTWAESCVGEGATFFWTLPTSKPGSRP